MYFGSQTLSDTLRHSGCRPCPLSAVATGGLIGVRVHKALAWHHLRVRGTDARKPPSTSPEHQPHLQLAPPLATMGCYCGCATRDNRLRWLAAGILTSIAVLCLIASIVLYSDDSCDGVRAGETLPDGGAPSLLPSMLQMLLTAPIQYTNWLRLHEALRCGVAAPVGRRTVRHPAKWPPRGAPRVSPIAAVPAPVF